MLTSNDMYVEGRYLGLWTRKGNIRGSNNAKMSPLVSKNTPLDSNYYLPQLDPLIQIWSRSSRRVTPQWVLQQEKLWPKMCNFCENGLLICSN